MHYSLPGTTTVKDSAEDSLLQVVVEPFSSKVGTDSSVDMDKEEHSRAVRSIVRGIEDEEFQKVVLTRTKTLDLSIDSHSLFTSCVREYPDAFVYHFITEDGTVWVGATPELLLERTGQRYRTMSLAGTIDENGAWTEKEREEQRLVTEYIVDRLERVGAYDIDVGDVHEICAGPLRHLRSEMSFQFSGPESELLGSLHPTPAVCGTPVDKAKKMISELESHDRRLYSGFIGIREEQRSRYFVNLRCARIQGNSITLYAGGGITGGSDPEAEWKETENKMRTLERFLK